MSGAAGRPLRVLWLVKGLGPGGAERLLVEQAAAGDHDHFSYDAAYLLPWKAQLVPEMERHPVTVHCLAAASELDPRWLPRLGRLIRRGRFDIVHIHSPSVAAGARLVIRAQARTARPAVVYTEHNRWPSYGPVTRCANRATYRMNDATIAVSTDVRDSVAPRLRERVAVITHGVDPARVLAACRDRDHVRAELGVGPGEVLAVTVANLRAQKNYPGLLAAARLVADWGVPVRFAAAGQGPLEADVRARHASLGLGERFLLLGYRPDATSVIAAADVFVLASLHEGQPVSVMEALMLGVPVVAPSVGGLPEAVEHERTGLLVAPGDDAALAAALTRVATDVALRSRLAAAAPGEAARFTAERAAREVESVYRAVALRAP